LRLCAWKYHNHWLERAGSQFAATPTLSVIKITERAIYNLFTHTVKRTFASLPDFARRS
jgi:hypothetical protein